MITYNLEKQGETLIFLNPDVNPDGRLEIEMILAPDSIGPKAHIHTRSDEGFRVIAGIPIVVQNILLGSLATLARILGRHRAIAPRP